MSYIGKEPQTGAYSMLDALTASATASYSLTLDSVAFVPESANHLLVSLNGSIQKAGSSYTVSGSTLTFSSTLASSDSIDFVLALGNVLDIGTPSDATVTNAKTNFVSTSSSAGLQIKGDGTTDGTLQLNCSQNSHGVKIKSPAHSASASYTLTLPTTDGSADEFLKTDGSGVLSWASAGGTNTPYFHVYLSSDQTVSSGGTHKVQFDTEVYDSNNNYDNSSNYRYTPTVAGKYLFYSGVVYLGDSNGLSYHKQGIQLNGSTYIARGEVDPRGGSMRQATAYCQAIQQMNGSSDYVEVYSFVASNTSTSLFESEGRMTYFGGYKIIE